MVQAVLDAPRPAPLVRAPAARSTRSARSARSQGVFVAAIGLTVAAASLTLIGWLALAGAGDLVPAVRDAQIRMVGPFLVAAVAAIFLAERLWPAVPRRALARAHVVDAGYLLMFAIVGPFVTLLNTGFAVVIERHFHFLMVHRLPLVPHVAIVVATVVWIDGMNWAAHVANHRITAIWRFHALHHSQEEMSVLTTFRTHPLAHVSYLPALIPALVLEASGTVPPIVLIAYGCFVTLPHANLPWDFGPFGRFLVSPAYHRLHHSRGPVAGRAAVNFGFVLVIWDQLAGCAAHPSGIRAIPTGIAGRPVPIEQSARSGSVPKVVVEQLVQPFRLRAATDGRP
jgi:sterol desaturase/sphingolipid hydroxylase (fatty acid hydroxylase superfamily)